MRITKALCCLLGCLLFCTVLWAGEQPNTSLSLLGRSQSISHVTQLVAEDWRWLRQKEVLVLGASQPDFPPFDVTTSGRDYEGITADIAGIIAGELGVRVDVRRFPDRQSAMKALASGEIDFLGTANQFEADTGYTLSLPYVKDQPALVQQPGAKWAEARESIRVAYAKGYIAENVLSELFPKAKLHPYDSNLDALAAVAFGRAEVALSDAVSASYIINRHYANELQVVRLGRDIGSQGFSFALSRGNIRLLRIINAVLLQALSRDQKHNALRRWSGGGVVHSELLKLSVKSREWATAHSPIRIGVPNDFPPYSYMGEDGRHYGITADILSLIKSQYGLEIEVTYYPTLPALLQALDGGKIDAVADVSETPERRAYMEFSRPYTLSPQALVVRNETGHPGSFFDLNGRVLAVQKNYSLIPKLYEDYPGIKLHETNSIQESIALVSQGEAEAVLLPLSTARYFMTLRGVDNLRVGMTISDHPSQGAFAVRRGEHELLAILDEALLGFSPDELSVISNRWRMQTAAATPSWRDYRTQIYQIVTVVLILLLAFLAWNFSLRQQVRRRKQAELELNDQLQFMGTLINDTPHPIYVRDKTRRLLLCNESYLRVLSVSSEEAIGSIAVGHGVLDLASVTAIEADQLEVLEHSQKVIIDRTIEVSGQELTIYHWLLPFTDGFGNVKGLIGGWIDISDRRALVEQLQAEKERANEANRTKSTFLATMSHEIRTPLNAIIGMLELALKRSEKYPVDRASLDVAHTSAQGLVALIGDILDISRIESGKLTLSPERVDLVHIVESVVRVFDGLARQKGLRLTLDVEAFLDRDLLIDPLRLKQVLSNLVSNAIKFTERGAVRIKLHCEESQRARQRVRLEVIDSGIGIAEEVRGKLFQPFAQAQAGMGGAGLGLMISRTLCEMMGGSLELESTLGVGTRAIMVLDVLCLGAKQRVESSPALPDDSPVAALHVLVVDDHPANRLLLTQQLEFLGHSVKSAADGEQALHIWQEGNVDLVFTDCNMPVMDGYTLARSIRDGEAAGADPCTIIGFTANALPEERQRCLEAGMNRCLFKPVQLVDLERVIKALKPSVVEPASKLFNADELQQLTGGNLSITRQLLGEMLKSNRLDMQLLEKLMASGSPQDLAELAHKIKGAAKIIKADSLVRQCANLEAACRQAVPEAIAAEARCLYQAMQGLGEELESELGEYS